MDTMKCYMLAKAATAAGNANRTFDWDKAAKMIADRNPQEVRAGLEDDHEWTGGAIFRDGKIVDDDYTYLSSCHAAPQVVIDGEYIECWVLEEGSGWDSDTTWPDSAREIIKELS